MKLIKPERINLKGHQTLNEKWVQNIIAEDPNILGLGGDVVLKDKERIQPSAGRIDLLLQDSELPLRFEVEIQLGKTDESHIIRTLEYWDIERKRYPQYDHCAVIVAEDVSSRFHNVIGLFNGTIPVIAIQMKALKIGDRIALDFTKVIDLLTLGPIDEDEERETTDRAYWENKGTKETVELVDKILELIHTFEPGMQLKFNKFYIGLAIDGKPKNFVVFRAKKKHVRIELKLEESRDVQNILDEADLDAMDYDKRWSSYRIRISKEDIIKKKDVLIKLLKMASDYYGS